MERQDCLVPCHYQLILASNEKLKALNTNTDGKGNERTRPCFQRIPVSLGKDLSRGGSEWKPLRQVHHGAFHEEVRTSVTGKGL